MRSTNIKANARVAELNTATKLALLHFKGVDCSGVAKITEMGIGPKELTEMVKKATKTVAPALRKLYLEFGNMKLETAVEEFIKGLEDSSKIAKRLEKSKDQTEMLRIVCSVQAAIFELEKITSDATKEISKIPETSMSAEAETLYQTTKAKHDFDMLDDLLDEARAQTNIPTAPKSTPSGGRRKVRRNTGLTRRKSKSRSPTKRCSRQKSWHQKNTRRHRKRPVCL